MTPTQHQASIVGPFQNPDVPSLAKVRDRIAADQTLSPIRRRDICSAINSMAKAARGTAEQIPADFEILRRRTAGFHPAHANISQQRWRNVKSEVAFALKHLALPKAAAKRLVPFLPEWQRLWDVTADRDLRWALSRVFHYCSALNIHPADVTDETLEEFQMALIQESFIGDPERLTRRTATLWNEASLTVPGWPSRQLTVVDRRNHYTIPIEKFPATFQADVKTFLERVAELSRVQLRCPHCRAPITTSGCETGRVVLAPRSRSAKTDRRDPLQRRHCGGGAITSGVSRPHWSLAAPILRALRRSRASSRHSAWNKP